MKSNAARSRRPHAARKPVQAAPLTQMAVIDSLRSWVVPTVAAALAFVIFVAYNLGLVDDASAVTSVGIIALLTVLFFGLRSFLSQRLEGKVPFILGGFALLWCAAAMYPFYRTVNPGTPVFATQLVPNGPAVTLPLRGQAGRFSITVEGHFLPAEGRTNRTATYSIALGHDGTTDRVLQGTFSQTWGTQRIGSGRRSSVVPTMHQITQARDTFENPEGRDLTLQLTNVSPGIRDNLDIRVYAENLPQWALILLSVMAVVGAVFIDAWRPKGANEGLMTTLTVAAFVSIAVFRVSTPVNPGFPQLAVAALMGTLAGALGGILLWRLGQPLHKYIAPR
jgi:small basic protein